MLTIKQVINLIKKWEDEAEKEHCVLCAAGIIEKLEQLKEYKITYKRKGAIQKRTIYTDNVVEAVLGEIEHEKKL